MKQVYVARDYGTKARLVLEVAGDEEKHGSRKQAIVYYGLHLRYMAVHVFKEVARRRKDEMLNMAQSCRRICTHRAGLQRLAVHKSQQSCCGSVYIPLDPAAPSQLAPWEWKGWLEMCKGTGDIETALMKLGLIKMEARETVALRLAEASRANVNVALSQQCNPNINVNPNISGPTTNISGPTTTVNPSIVSSNAQTGEGAVQPTVGAGMPASAGSSGYMMPGMPSGDYAAAFMAAQQQQLMMQQAMLAMMQQQQQQAAGQGGPPAAPFGGAMPMAPYAMPMNGYAMPQQGSGPMAPASAPPTPPPVGYPPPADGFPAKA
ncbi:hypothetical protein COHA_002711 [Chlorella ohadii]|uniref:Uncharacterized protein n=1 Tax=Chlorella ohadii TaxID=2649997 RepID=A0AAD5H7G6_9CHLO|nr:hypothetical protein COHA_002711 [Chlorella ohadii]